LAARRRANLIIKDMLRSNTEVLPESLSIRHQGSVPASLALAWTGCSAALINVHVRTNGELCVRDFTAHAFGDDRQQSLAEIGESISAHPQRAIPSACCRLSQEVFWSKL
jgi:hypothetical protein